jgi:uncharacterized iron-regulated membrane protein
MTASSSRARNGIRDRPRRAVNWPRVALVVHNWLGLKLFLVLAVVLLSGTLAVFRYEIDWLIYPELRVTPADSLASLDDILAAVKTAYPEMGLGGEIPTGVGAGNLAIGIVGVSPDRGIRLIWVDPYRATVQGDTPLMTPGFFLASLHRDLFIPDWGLAIVCAIAVVLVVSLVTGLLAYRRFWRGFLRRPRLRTLRLLMIDLHKLIGLWSLWFIIVIALTGLWYFWTLVGEPMLGFPQAVQKSAPPELAAERLEALGPDAPAKVSLDGALSRATALYPDFVAEYVSLPDHHGAPVVFHGNRGEILARYATTIAVDPFSGEILGADLASEAPLSSRIGAMVNPLHYGDFGGLLSKTVWFTFGLALSSLAITGVVIFWCRASQATAGLAASLLRAFHPWRGAMGWFKPLNWAMLAGLGTGAVMTAQFYSRGLADAPARYAPQEIGPWRLGVTLIAGFGDTSDPVAPAAPVVAVVEYCSGCWEDIRRLWVAAGPTPPSDGDLGYPVQGQPGFAVTQVVLPQELDAQQRLWLIAEGWDRRLHRSSWVIRKSDPGAEPAP